jgi:maltose alpha-D-glucosyltransferase/alpha-amylase
MPQIFKSLASGNKSPIESILSKEVTPEIPESAQWFTFLRCHDELSLELVYVSEEDRKYIHENYCHEPLWNFRLGQGVASRLSELFKRNPERIALAYSVMLSLPGTPIIYYGDEFGKLNDESYYREQIKLTGKDDTRFLVRGNIDWPKVEEELENRNSLSFQVFNRVKNLVNTRNKYNVFGRGEINWTAVYNQEGDSENRVLAYVRSFENRKILVLNNLSNEHIWIKSRSFSNEKSDILGQEISYGKEEGHIQLKPYQYFWIKI